MNTRITCAQVNLGPVMMQDNFVAVADIADAVHLDFEGFWTFGIGLLLECTQNTYPRFNMHLVYRVRRSLTDAAEIWEYQFVTSGDEIKSGADGPPIPKEIGFRIHHQE